MNRNQRKLANLLVDGVSYSNEYMKACEKGIDLCILPNPKNDKGVIVKFIDRASETFVKNKSNKKPLEKAYTISGGVDKLIDNLKDVISGKYPIKEFNINEVMDNINTDLCKLYKELERAEIDDSRGIINYFKNNKKI